MNSIPSPVPGAPVNPQPKAHASPTHNQNDAVAASRTAEQDAAERSSGKARAADRNRAASEGAKTPAKAAKHPQHGGHAKQAGESAASGGKTVKQPTTHKATEAAAANPATPDEGDTTDFAEALAQTLNADGAAPQITAPVTAKGATTKGPVKGNSSPDVDLTALQALLGMPVPVVPPTTQAFAAAAGASATAQQGTDLLGAIAAKTGQDVLALLNEIQDKNADPAPSDGSTDAVATATPFSLTAGVADPARADASAATSAGKTLHTPVGTQAWADDLSARVSLMATKQGHQTASLSLTPEHLGPLEIRISIRDDQASVWFGAAHADTRAAIEHALPQLREQFAAQGMSLTDAGVFREPPRDNARRDVSGSASAARDEPAVESTVSVVARRMGLVDAFV